MASIKYGALIVSMAGKIGGTVFKRGKSGPTASNVPTIKPSPIAKFICLDVPVWGRVCNYCSDWRPSGNPSTYTGHCTSHLWGYVQRTMPQVSSTWRDLDPMAQATWATAAPSFPRTNKFGDLYTPSAFNLYTSLNTSRQLMQENLLPTAPEVPTITPPGECNFVVTTDGSMCLFMDSAVPNGQYLEISATAQVSRGRSSSRGGFKTLLFIDHFAGPNIDIAPFYINKFGTFLFSSQVIFRYRMVHVASGVTQAWSTFKCNVITGTGLTSVMTGSTVTTLGVTTATLSYASTNCITAIYYKLTPGNDPTTRTGPVTITPNATASVDVVITETTLFIALFADSEGNFQSSGYLAVFP